MRRFSTRALAALAASAAITCGGESFTASGSGTGGSHQGDAGVGGASGSGANAGTGASGSGSGGGSAAGGGIASGGGKSSGGATGSGGRASGGASSGGASAGGAGGRSSGGTAGTASGGSSGAGGAGGVPTCGPDVSFNIVPGGPAGMAQFCTSAPNMCGGGVSLTVLDAEGQVVTMALGCGLRNCASCSDAGCPPFCGFSTLIPSSGLGVTWPGTRWLPGTCGENVACFSPSCAEHGSYGARMCGYAMTGTGGVGGAAALPVPVSPCEQLASKTPTCVDVPFQYPPSGVVSGVLDPRK